MLNVELFPAENGGRPLQVGVHPVRRLAEGQPVVRHSCRHGRHHLRPAVISPVFKAARARQTDLLLHQCCGNDELSGQYLLNHEAHEELVSHLIVVLGAIGFMLSTFRILESYLFTRVLMSP